MKRFPIWILMLLCCVFLLSGCTHAANPLAAVEATPLPGAAQELHQATASENNVSTLEVTLFFRYLNYPFLAGEDRTLTVKKDESNETALLRALLEGPTAEKTDLRRLFSEEVSLKEVSASGDMLFVTLSSSFLKDEVPSDWQNQAQWKNEAPILRLLTVQSLVNSITESLPYTSVQIMIDRAEGSKSNTRLEKSYFLTGGSGPADPLSRREDLILTAHNTAALLMQAWQERDFETLYAFTSTYADYQTRPVYDDFLNAMDASPTLTDYSLTPGSTSESGQHSTLSLNLSLRGEKGETRVEAYPLRLVRENAVWKVTFQTLQDLMLR